MTTGTTWKCRTRSETPKAVRHDENAIAVYGNGAARPRARPSAFLTRSPCVQVYSSAIVERTVLRASRSFIGARLPIVKSAEENHALFDFVDRYSKALPGDFDVEWGVWLGAGMVTDEAWEREGGAWLWADGTSFEVSRPGHTFW